MARTRTVTLLFCDLVGSTELQSRIGDDANDRVRRNLFAALREAITTYGGPYLLPLIWGGSGDVDSRRA